MEGSNLGDQVPPRRTSAKKAAVAFTGQLDTTDESNSGGSGNEGQPSVRKLRVSFQKKYGKRAKRMNSASMNEAAVTTQESKKMSSPSLEPVSILAAPSASVTPMRPRPRPRPAPKRALPQLPLLAVAAPRQPEENEYSPLTSLSSSSEASSIPEIVELPKPIISTSISAPPTTGLNPKSFPGPSKGRKEPMWAQATLGTYVWALINPKTSSVYDEENDRDDHTEDRLWWPGKIKSRSTEVPLKIFLFGPGRGNVVVENPSQANVLSNLDHLYCQRFSTPTFVSPSYSFIDLSSPRKKPKIDRDSIEREWKGAVEEELKDMNLKLVNGGGDESDDLPEVLNIFDHLHAPTSFGPPQSTLLQSKSKDTNKMKGKRKRKDDSDISADEDLNIYGGKKEDEFWEPPEVDDDLSLPGELVIARDRPSATVEYWPAMLIGYIPPSNRKQVPKYSVIWVDDTQGVVERAWFYTMHEDGFATCKLGEIESSVVEVQNDNDNEVDSPQAHNLSRRSPSPETSDPPPSPKEFADLSIRQQFVYTKNVLQAILKNEYTPTQSKHDRFMNGGKHRQSVVDDAALRGKMDPQDVEHLQIYIREWCLRDDGRVAPIINDDVLLPNVNVKETNDVPTENEEERTDMNAESTSGSMMDLEGTRSESPLPTEVCPSSPPEIPPSSFPPGRLEREDSIISDSSHPEPSDSLLTATEPKIRMKDGILDLTNPDNNPITTESTSLTRPRGSEDFESLSPLVKIDYCVNILLPEVVRQILLWRTGQRTSTALLPSAEEEDLYERGEVLLKERDWVNDIMRYRAMVRKGMEKRAEKRELASMARKRGHNRNDSASRPRRNVVIPNYQE